MAYSLSSVQQIYEGNLNPLHFNICPPTLTSNKHAKYLRLFIYLGHLSLRLQNGGYNRIDKMQNHLCLRSTVHSKRESLSQANTLWFLQMAFVTKYHCLVIKSQAIINYLKWLRVTTLFPPPGALALELNVASIQLAHSCLPHSCLPLPRLFLLGKLLWCSTELQSLEQFRAL